ncbi:MAG: indolepyruvate oxidoreductase subunit beta [Candidatus Heimdallarchaeota archaeon]|nr:indolepyruvate oxidoreductase subunit beta [Candidatus Heimdallarchaeota archaeon]
MVNTSRKFNIIITGIGGQGTVSIGHILGNIFHEVGYQIIAAETHGMSQRGGSVVFHLRVGNNYGTIIPKGMADVIISGEPMEALRVIEYLKPNGHIITNTHGILSPVAVNLGMKYPKVDAILQKLEEWPAKVYNVNTGKLAEDLKISRGENLILMGAFLRLGLLELDTKLVEDIIQKRWPKFVETNLKALRAGYDIIDKSTIVA